MSNLLSLVIDPVFRQARRLSGVGPESHEPTDTEEGSHAASHPSSSQHAGPSSAAGNDPSDFDGSTEDRGVLTHHTTAPSIAIRRNFIRRPWFTHRSEENLRSRHSPSGISRNALREQTTISMPSPSSITTSNDRTTHGSSHGVPTGFHADGPERFEPPSLSTRPIRMPPTSTGRPNAGANESDGPDSWTMANSLPADDGMRLLRQRIHEIRDMHASSEEKARRMHSVMTEKYLASRAHFIRPQSPSSIISQDRPFTPSSSQSQSEWETHLTTPVSLYSTYDPENPFNIQPHDLLPTYRIDESRQPTSETAQGEDEEEGEEEQSFGCKHYKRNVKIQCFDCRRWYTCRHCHNEVEEHALNRQKTRHMLCMFCQTPQAAAEYCKKCNECAAWYYCDICKLWDDDSSKKIYHCDDCGICRQGEGLGKDYFHCKKCNVCISIKFADDHRCLEGATERDCPICGEYLHTSITPAAGMPCGHYLHQKCYDDYMNTAYKCPICKKSAVNMELQWRKLTHDIESQPMPPPFANTRVYIQCNDCSTRSSVKYHFLGNKCNTCDSYNTNELHFIAEPDLSQIVLAAQQMEMAEPSEESPMSPPTHPIQNAPRVAQLRSGGSYFHGDRDVMDDPIRLRTAALAFEHLRLSPQDILQRFSRSLSPIRNYLNGSSDDVVKARGVRERKGEGEEDKDMDFWGSDGRFLSGDEDAAEQSEDEDSDESQDEREDLDEDDEGDEELDRIDLIGHR